VTSILGADDMLVINDTKVIPARLHFRKSTGGVIEVFCLDPHHAEHQVAMAAGSGVQWNCLVGGAKKWKDEPITHPFEYDGLMHDLIATKVKIEDQHFVIAFSWNVAALTFSDVLMKCGEIPLPPYFDRDPDPEDIDRYQTVFAQYEGSVAAPTAGLHFTPEVLSQLGQNGVAIHRVTLHVGAGTFKPVSSETIGEHSMHEEVFVVPISLIKALLEPRAGRIIPVGTTSLRTLESLYWIGLKCLQGEQPVNGRFSLVQWECYELPQNISKQECLQALLDFASANQLSAIQGVSSLMIAPCYTFRIANGLMTNFHLPKSTLILLVAAMIGDAWKDVYQFALANDFKFLSYGDSSVLLPNR
jgi:S-adenosylmethionine:tRNA ribosyltransferase-isomerase